MERRKVQKTGGSTYTVSLPKKWVKEHVGAGDEITMVKEEDSLRIHLKEDEEEEDTASIEYEKGAVSSVRRKIIALYLAGYNEIRIEANDRIEERREIEGMARNELIGLEVTETSEDEIVLQNLLKYSDLPVKQVVLRLNSIIDSSYREFIDSLKSDEELPEIQSQEEEADRLYLLGVRQTNSAVRNRSKMEKMNIEHESICISQRQAMRNLEGIMDRLVEITEHLEQNPDVRRNRMIEIASRTHEYFQEVMESVIKDDPQKAEEALRKSGNVEKDIESMEKEMETRDHDVKTVLYNLERTRRLSKNIAESVINMSVHKEKGENYFEASENLFSN